MPHFNCHSANDDPLEVQLQLLTSVVKLFLKRPTDTQQLVQRVLSLATQDSDNPDLRDRGYGITTVLLDGGGTVSGYGMTLCRYIYWRLLSADPAAAKQVRLLDFC